MREDLNHLNKYIAKFELLTHEEELECSKQIEAAEKDCWEAVLADVDVAAELHGKSVTELCEADMFKEVLHESINTSESIEVKKAASKWLKARDRLVNHNLRLALHTAIRYANKRRPLPDMFQEACTGLIAAAERYDWRRGLRFSTIATYWIRHYIHMNLSNTSRTIRLPKRSIEEQSQLRKLSAKYVAVNGTSPSLEELAILSGIEKDRVTYLIESSINSSFSLDAPVSSESEDLKFLDTIASDAPGSNPEHNILNQELHMILERYIRRLPPGQEAVIRQRFALSDDSPQTLEDVGSQINVCRERVRQIQNESLHKLKKLLEKDRVVL